MNNMELLCRAVPWVYRTYMGRGFDADYFPVVLTAWQDVIAHHLDPPLAAPILHIYGWMSAHHPYWLALSQSSFGLPGEAGELVNGIASASSEQAQGIAPINTAVAEMDKVVQQNAATAEEAAAGTESICGQADRMRERISELSAMVFDARREGQEIIGLSPLFMLIRLSAEPVFRGGIPSEFPRISRKERPLLPAFLEIDRNVIITGFASGFLTNPISIVQL